MPTNRIADRIQICHARSIWIVFSINVRQRLSYELDVCSAKCFIICHLRPIARFRFCLSSENGNHSVSLTKKATKDPPITSPFRMNIETHIISTKNTGEKLSWPQMEVWPWFVYQQVIVLDRHFIVPKDGRLFSMLYHWRCQRTLSHWPASTWYRLHFQQIAILLPSLKTSPT